jgi:hypothetical protein
VYNVAYLKTLLYNFLRRVSCSNGGPDRERERERYRQNFIDCKLFVSFSCRESIWVGLANLKTKFTLWLVQAEDG